MLRHVPVRAHEGEAVVGRVAAARPDLRAVHRPTRRRRAPQWSARRRRLTRRWARRGTGSRSPHPQDRREVPQLLLLGAELQQHRGAGRERRDLHQARGTRSPTISSLSTRWCSGVSPSPPYSFGKHTPASPPSKSSRWSSRETGDVRPAPARRSSPSGWATPVRPRRAGVVAQPARARARNSSTVSIARRSWSGPRRRGQAAAARSAPMRRRWSVGVP